MATFLLSTKIRRRLREEVYPSELRVLIGAYLILIPENRWVKGSLAGRYVQNTINYLHWFMPEPPTSSGATCFCLNGALLRSRDELGEWFSERVMLAQCFYLCEPHVSKDIVELGNRLGAEKAMARFNDTLGYHEVVNLLRTSIKENTRLRPWQWKQ